MEAARVDEATRVERAPCTGVESVEAERVDGVAERAVGAAGGFRGSRGRAVEAAQVY